MTDEKTPQGSAAQGQRRKAVGLLVNKALVKRYVLLVVAITMIASALIGFIIHQTIKQTLEEESLRPVRTGAGVYNVLMKVNNQLLTRVFFVLFLSLIVTAVTGIMFLHKIAGPMHRIRTVLRSMADGNLPKNPVKLREGDFFVDVVDELNRLIERIRGKGGL